MNQNDFTTMRHNMIVGQIEPAGVVDENILSAFSKVPRENFVPEGVQSTCYRDEDLVFESGGVLLEPCVHARLLQNAELKKDLVCLVLGDNCGYASAILAQLVSTVIQVVTDERAQANLEQLYKDFGITNIVIFIGNFQDGNPPHAPYDYIFINGSVGKAPKSLFEQLAPEGSISYILRESPEKKGTAFIDKKTNNSSCSKNKLFDASTPYVSGFEPQGSFNL